MTGRFNLGMGACVAAAILVMPAGHNRVLAECVAMVDGRVCPAVAGAQLIVLADVLAVEGAGPGRIAVQLRVLEVFKGSIGEEPRLPFQLTAESFSFARGQRLLLYTQAREGVWSSTCVRIRAASTVDREVAALRSLAGGQPGALVEGDVWNPGQRNGRLFAGGLEVSLNRGGVSVAQSLTDASGAFMLGWVAPGRYVLLVSGAQFRSQQREVIVAAGEGCQILPTIRVVGRAA